MKKKKILISAITCMILENIMLSAISQAQKDKFCMIPLIWCFPGGSDGKKSARNAGDLGSALGWGDPLEKGKATHSSILA